GDMSQPGPLPGACTPNVNLDHYGCVTWSATYSMVVMTALYHYYLYTGDRRFVRQHWQAVVRQMEWDAQHIGSDGLFSVTAHEGADWNVDVHSGELTYVNAVYVQALRSTAKLATALGHSAQAKEWSAAATAGDEAAALSTIRREWGFMIRHDPGGVEWERIQPNGIPAGGPIADSSAHAWSTGPTAALSMYVLGVRPASPGYRHWTVGPQPG